MFNYLPDLLRPCEYLNIKRVKENTVAKSQPQSLQCTEREWWKTICTHFFQLDQQSKETIIFAREHLNRQKHNFHLPIALLILGLIRKKSLLHVMNSKKVNRFYWKDTAESFGEGSSQQSISWISPHFSCNHIIHVVHFNKSPTMYSIIKILRTKL